MLVAVSIFLLLQIMLKCKSLYIGKCSDVALLTWKVCAFALLTDTVWLSSMLLYHAYFRQQSIPGCFPLLGFMWLIQPARLPLCMVYFEPRHTPDLISENNTFPFPPSLPICMGAGNHLQKVMPLKGLKPWTPFSSQPSRLQGNKHSETL